MSPVHFKLKYGQSLRRLTFQSQPNWADLSGRLQAIYNLPLERVGVSYIDSDQDEITVSSHEELQDYYNSSYKVGEPIKFNVLDLSASREVVPPSVNRNTFGADPFDFIEPDWQRIPGISLPQDLSLDGPHAFVEVVPSDISTMDQDDDSDSEDERSTARAPLLDKGKSKASSVSLGAASVTSLVAEQSSKKYPIHVIDVSSLQTPTPGEQEKASTESNFVQSTPKASAKDVEMTEADDPPLPTINGNSNPAPPNFATDLSSLLATLSGVITTHPELSEGVRNLIQNATNGSYWHTHQAAFTETVEGIAQAATEEARNLEAEAAQRVYEALGNFFRAFALGEAPNVTEAERGPATEPADPAAHPFGPFGAPPHRFPGFRGRRSGSPWRWDHGFGFPRFGWPGAPPPHPPFHRPFGPHPPFHHSHPHHPPPPRPPHMPPPPPAPHMPPPPFGMHHPSPPPPPAHPYPSPPDHDEPQPPSPPLPGAFPHDHDYLQRGPPYLGGPRPGARDPFVGGYMPHMGMGMEAGPSSIRPPVETGKLTTEELRARVEKAKQDYRAQKQAYRRERDDRRKTKDSFVHPSNDPTLVSNAKGSFPEFEIVSVPRRSNTLPANSGPRRGFRQPSEDAHTRAVNKVVKRMDDMGFTETSHPGILDKIKSNLPPIESMSTDQEDDIIATLLEDLLFSETAPAQVSSSTYRAP